MHHAATQHFQPFAVFAHHVNFRRRFSEREVGWTETNLQVFLKEVVQEIVQRALQVGEADVFINNQTFHLVEHWGMGLIVIVTIDATRRDDADWRFLILHGTDLYARGLGTQQTRGVKPESVVVSACRMMARNIQGIEVVIIIFNFRASRHGKAELTEETFNAIDGTGNRMQPPVFDTATRQRNVDRLCGQARIQHRAFQLGFTRVQCLLHLLFSFVNHRTRCRAFFWRQFTQGCHLKGQVPFLPKIFDADIV